MNFADRLNHYVIHYQEQIRFLEQLLPLFPPGDLHYRRNGKALQFILHIDGRHEYIHTRNRPYIREMVLKDFLKAHLTDCRAELKICKAISKALAAHPHTLAKKESFLELMTLREEAYRMLRENGTFFTNREWQNLIRGNTDEQFRRLAGNEYTHIIRKERRRLAQLKKENPDVSAIQTPPIADRRTAQIRNLLSGSFTEYDITVQAFLSEPFPSNPHYSKGLIHTTMYGEKMRSKIEVRTAELLHSLGIPYRYEAQLIVGDLTYYPDFTLMHPVSHEIFILEIFGMTDDPDYRKDMAKKMYHYTANGYIINQNLLCYSEQQAKPIDFIQMKKDLEYRFT